MFCSQCGKKVMDSMLFCPFCGSPIVIPEQEAGATVVETLPVQEPEQPVEESVVQEEAPVAEPASEESSVRRFVESGPLNISINWGSEDVVPESDDEAGYDYIDDEFEDDEDDDVVNAFVPLDLEALEVESIEPVSDKGVTGEISELLSSQLNEEPVHLGGHVPDLTNVKNPGRASGKNQGKKSTYAPVKAFNPNDIFLDGEDEEEYDDYEEEDYDYEEPEYGGFFVRHIRGLVALSLCIVVLAIVAGWAFSDAGQMALANANLAWRPSVYESLGYQAYQNGSYALSAGYYEKALARETDNYSYAYSAGIAYYMGGDVARAAEMSKTAIEINPSSTDAYQLLLRLYPDAATRPWDVSSLLQRGYQLTGDASLNVES